MATEQDGAKNAGRGGLFVLAAKVFFLVLGFVQQVVLQRDKVLGAQDYGLLALVLAQSNIPNNVLVSASVQGVSRVVAAAPGGVRSAEGRAALKGALTVHAPLALFAGGAFAFAAPSLAAAVRAPQLGTPLVVMAVVLTCYGLYAPLVGALNGSGRFGAQASLDGAYATLRTAGLIGGAIVLSRLRAGDDALRGDRVFGATLGVALASAAIIGLAVLALRSGPRDVGAAVAPTFDYRGYVRFLAPILATQLFVNLLMQVDITLLGRFLGDATQGSPDGTRVVGEWVGVYRACQLLAFLPYQLLASVTQVLFPLVAKADAAGDREGVRAAVARGARLACVAGGLLVTVLATLPSPLLHVVSPARMADPGGPTLRLLVLAQAAFALLGVATTVLGSLRRAGTSAAITVVALAATVGLAYALVPGAPLGAAALQRMALATGGGLIVGLIFAAVAVARAAGTFVPWKTALRVGGTLAVFVTAGAFLPALPTAGLAGKLLALGAAGAVAIAYLAALAATGELNREDLAVLRRVTGR